MSKEVDGRIRWVGYLAGVLSIASMVGCPEAPLPDGSENPPKDHAEIFKPDGSTYSGTASCLECHAEQGEAVKSSLHWTWKGPANIIGHEGHVHGKADLINNFCIAVASNEARCTECHAGYGWKDGTFDFADATKIDCLVCHDTSGLYAKDPQNAGMPKAGIDLQTVASSVGSPTRRNCGACHFYAGGGDNVKHGDLASTLVSPTRDQDVHMGGLDMSCQACHTTSGHKIAGAYLHSVESEGTVDCTDCHTPEGLHTNPDIDLHLDTIACQTCHIPYIARSLPTIVEWYWKEAGQDLNPAPVDEFGKPYDKKKGRQVWARNVMPTYLWYNRKTHRYMLDSGDTTTVQPVVIARPDGSISDANAKIYPFKAMVGNQPGDAVYKSLLTPHLFGSAAGPNAYWKAFNWELALAEGTAAAGQSYSGQYEWVNTVMYLGVNHEIAPKEQALGCKDCHASISGRMDFKALGYAGNPWVFGER
jgi:octaheme c-type cytochrome (tetrathionate reductase family)